MTDKILKAAEDGDWGLVKQILRVCPELAKAKTPTVLGAFGNISLLHMAAKTSNNKIATLLLSKGADINAEDSGGWTPIFYAAEAGQAGMVKYLIRRGAKMDIEDGTPILLLALLSGDQNTVQILWQKGATGGSPLLDAIIKKDAKTLKQLLSVDPSLASKEIKYKNSQPLHWAVLVGDKKIITTLLDYDAKPAKNHHPNSSHRLPSQFYLAVKAGKVKIAEILFNKDPSGISATPVIIAAVESGNRKMVEFLIGKGATISVKDINDSSLMHHCGSPEVVKLLIEKGLKINDTNRIRRTPLHTAARNGNKEVVLCLIDAGATINDPDACKTTPLHTAANFGHMETVKILIEKGADINAVNSNKTTPLLLSLKRRNKEVAKFLIDKGADVKLADRHGQTTLHLAASIDAPEIVKTLIRKGVDVNAYHSDTARMGKSLCYYYPIELAAKSGNIEIVELLIKSGADLKKSDALSIALFNGWTKIATLLFNQYPDSIHRDRKGHSVYALVSISPSIFKTFVNNIQDVKKPDDDGNTLLHYAAKNGNNEIIRILIKKGSDINALSLKGFEVITGNVFQPKQKYYRPIECAAMNGHDESVKLLVENGADLSKSATLHIYIIAKNKPMCEYLLAKGANVNAKDNEGKTPLHVAIDHNDISIVNILIEKGADINAKNNDGETPIFKTVKRRDTKLFELLINKGADIKAADKDGYTLLHLATAGNNENFIKILLEKGADVNAKSNNGDTVLLHALCKKSNLDTIKYLIEKSADPKAANNKGDTPLHMAAKYSTPEICKYIIDKGGDPKAANKEGATPLHYAVVCRKTETVAVLLENGADPFATNKDGQTPRDYAEKRIEELRQSSSVSAERRKEKFAEIAKILEAAEKAQQAKKDAGQDAEQDTEQDTNPDSKQDDEQDIPSPN